jgi:integrase
MPLPMEQRALVTPKTMTSSPIDQYVEAATRSNTRRSYQSAIRHFEIEWGGFLPATADSIARYLVQFAATQTVATLRQRLAALAQWHIDQGFPDPTKAPLVKKVLKGIHELHPAQPKQAKPFQLDQLQQLDAWLDRAIQHAQQTNNRAALLQLRRNRALVLLGFWRGFRSDELGRLCVEHIEVMPREGLRLFLPRTKGDRGYTGTTFRVPALAALCPVQACEAWLQTAALTQGPLFRGIDRWGRIADRPLHANSFIPLLRGLFAQAGIAAPDTYSSHSLRRGFAHWANGNGWDVKTLMEYVGWKDVKSAMRYVDGGDPFAQMTSRRLKTDEVPTPALPASAPGTVLTLTLAINRHDATVRGTQKLMTALMNCCLKPLHAQPMDDSERRYRIVMMHASAEELDAKIDGLLDELYQLAATHSHFLDATITDPATQSVWT